MLLLQLPFELQLLILNHIKKENHLDLAPIAQTCSYFSSLVADRFNWTHTVTFSPIQDITSLSYLTNAKRKSNQLLSTKKLQVNSSDCSILPLILNILEKQQFDNHLDHVNMMLPSMLHHKLFQVLIENPQTKLRQFTIRDSTDDGYIMSSKLHHMMLMNFISTTLSKSQSTLDHLEIPSFPANLLLSQYNRCQFSAVKTLKIALVGCHDEHHFFHYWRHFKSMFPNLQNLTLTLSKKNLPLFKFLLKDVSLFPWIKRLSIASRETPKNYLSRDELRSSLLQLNGLNRITAGWDMIALN